MGNIPNERQARELAPLAKEDPETAKRLWGGLTEEHGDDLTAKHVKKAVEEVKAARSIREQLPPATKTIVEGSDPDDTPLSRSPKQLTHLSDIARARGDEKAAEVAERVANGEFKDTFEAYPKVKAEATEDSAEPTVGELMTRAGVSMDDMPRRSEEEKALYPTWQAILKVSDPMTEALAEVVPEAKQIGELEVDATAARDRLTALIEKLRHRHDNRLRAVE